MKTNLQGVIPDLSNEQYHSMTEALSCSGLKEFAKSPAHFKAYMERKKEPTAAMKFGTGFHALVGEPQLFAAKYAKAPEGIDRRTKEGKERYAAFMAENQGKEILSHDDYERLDGMLGSVLKNKTALALLTNGVAEQSAFWRDPETGVLCKCRPDYLRKDGVVIDVKTTEDASVKGFQRAISSYQYHLQSAFYLDGLSQVLNEPLTDFVHVVIEKNAPYGVGIYTLDDASLNIARAQIKTHLAIYAECLKKDIWPSYADEVQNISIPAWMY